LTCNIMTLVPYLRETLQQFDSLHYTVAIPPCAGVVLMQWQKQQQYSRFGLEMLHCMNGRFLRPTNPIQIMVNDHQQQLMVNAWFLNVECCTLQVVTDSLRELLLRCFRHRLQDPKNLLASTQTSLHVKTSGRKSTRRIIGCMRRGACWQCVKNACLFWRTSLHWHALPVRFPFTCSAKYVT
jgi:hypothetical protein